MTFEEKKIFSGGGGQKISKSKIFSKVEEIAQKAFWVTFEEKKIFRGGGVKKFLSPKFFQKWWKSLKKRFGAYLEEKIFLGGGSKISKSKIFSKVVEMA